MLNNKIKTLKVGILGEPNTGKSTLFNTLINKLRKIISCGYTPIDDNKDKDKTDKKSSDVKINGVDIFEIANNLGISEDILNAIRAVPDKANQLKDILMNESMSNEEKITSAAALII